MIFTSEPLPVAMLFAPNQPCFETSEDVKSGIVEWQSIVLGRVMTLLWQMGHKNNAMIIYHSEYFKEPKLKLQVAQNKLFFCALSKRIG